MSALLTLAHIDKFYGATHALRGINLEVQSGEVVVLLGPSGCAALTVWSLSRAARLPCKVTACWGRTSAGTQQGNTSAWFSKAMSCLTI